MCDLIVDLPTSVVCSVLSKWLQLDDLARLDSACCNHKIRVDLLALFRSEGLSNKDTYHSSYATDMWYWILKRDLKVSYITSKCPDSDNEDFSNYVQRNANRVYHLEIAQENAFGQHCTQLTHLSCDSLFETQMSFLLRNNPKVESLDLTVHTKHAKLFNDIKLPNLTQIMLGCRDSGSEVSFAAVLGIATRLLKLEIRGVSKPLPTVGQFCPHLRSLQLDGFMQNRGLDLVAFTSYCPHIVNLKLDMCNTVTDAEILGIVKNLRELRTLSMHAYEYVLTDKAIESIAEHCADTLIRFQISFCNATRAVTRAALQQLQVKCSKLLTYRCHGKTGSTEGMDCITVLESMHDKLSNAALKKIQDDCPLLEVLDLSLDTTVKRCTEKGFRLLCEKCPKLHTIIVSDRRILKDVLALTKNLSQLTVTTSISCIRDDFMTLPV